MTKTGLEWRIFYSDIKFDPWSSNQKEKDQIIEMLEKAESEYRNDYYFDIKNAEHGLKERWGKHNPKLELKVRQTRYGKIESWEKCMVEPFKDMVDEDKGLDIETIEQYLLEELNNSKYPKSGKSIERMKQIIELLKDDLPLRIKNAKKRKQFSGIFDKDTSRWKFFLHISKDPNTILIEQTHIEVYQLQNQKPKTFKTICVEGNNKNNIEKFKEDFIKVGSGLEMGYPELIMSL